MRERERLEGRVAELEERVRAAEAEPQAAAPAEEGGLADRAEAAEARAAEQERRVKTLEAELEAARAEVKQARTDAESAAQRAGGEIAGEAAGAGGDAIRSRAEEVYENINDVLSELRNNLILVQGEFGDLARERSDDSSRIISETLETLVGNAEDAKGVLRGLRELVEFGE